jgi:hypothetical protein
MRHKKVVIISTGYKSRDETVMIDAILDVDTGKIVSWVPRIKVGHKSDS